VAAKTLLSWETRLPQAIPVSHAQAKRFTDWQFG